ncbi:hypothetical protein EDD16DRAFT_1557369 [Pisolithus croceorrhizus]|nr:hypothetical protein EDD16DRAFT_1557369 [Pisolithus croceorrhizus]KAI6128540.1 hypothetical protein EV401DRAFT_1930930 [Pisolithus croceorrhizus]KAI6159374.1 hypothetical protein EDD17DRAFT_1611991 [Pisolithus thermaeus]
MVRRAIHLPFLLSCVATYTAYDYLLFPLFQLSPMDKTNTQDNPTMRCFLTLLHLAPRLGPRKLASNIVVQRTVEPAADLL